MACCKALRSEPLAQHDNSRSEKSTTTPILLSRPPGPSPPPSELDTLSDATPPASSRFSASSSRHSSPGTRSRHASPSAEDPIAESVSGRPSELTSRNVRRHNEQSSTSPKFSPYLRSKSSRNKEASTSRFSSSSSPSPSSSSSSTSYFTNPTTPPDSRFGSPEVVCMPAFLSFVPSFLSGYPGDPLAQRDDGFTQRYMGRAPRYGYEFGPRDIEFENMIHEICQCVPPFFCCIASSTAGRELEFDYSDLDWNAFATEFGKTLASWPSAPKSKVQTTFVGPNGQPAYRAKLASF